jgi:DEAD/DEAH box helicase domain-containing protein
MIPSLLAQDVAQSLREFIITGFETNTWPFSGKFEELVHTHKNGEAFIKGPYVSINLPFAKKTDKRNFFNGFETEHSPFVHQQKSWERLASGKDPKSTIVATGTGSGKTECFLYPLLDHCQRNSKPGIKAIIIYPMNALAGDQAKRFATIINDTPSLKGKVRVGLFIGGAETTDKRSMGPDHVITCKKTLRRDPPDILLTNYKMLDYLLLRPKDQELWKNNDAKTLRYLVVDELHTFDGAQGTDLAMLIRRLKVKLQVSDGELVCVGTSATLGAYSQIGDLTDYASNIFDSFFDQQAVIAEERVHHEDFLSIIEYLLLDSKFTPCELKIGYYDSLNDYIVAQIKLFFGDELTIDPESMEDRIKLGQYLRKHSLLNNLLRMANSGPISVQDLTLAVEKQLPEKIKDHGKDVLISLLSLLSFARGENYPGEPLVTIRLQLWARELRRIVSRVGDGTPQNPVCLRYSDDLKAETGAIHLPTIQCTECHMTAWLTSQDQGQSHIEQDLRKIYNQFFSNDKQVRVLLPLRNESEQPPSDGLLKHLCIKCGFLQETGSSCQACHEEVMVMVFVPKLTKEVKRGGVRTLESQRLCPVCHADNSLLLFGSRAASLSSVAIHQMFANPINDDKKLIAFSDSVQDAAHRAGFFAARTWQNNVRMALAKAVHHYSYAQKKPMPFQELFKYLSSYWLKEESNPERLETTNYIVQFIAPHMQTRSEYIELKEHGNLENPQVLLDLVSKRLNWEILSEFGIRAQIGRSLERTGVATVYWDSNIIDKAAENLRLRCKEGLGKELSEIQAQKMLWGVTLRMKKQGAIYNELLKGYIDNGGDYWLLSRIPFLPDFGTHSVLPRFPGVKAEKNFDRLIPGRQATWYSRWITQLLDDGSLVDNNFVSDLLNLIMKTLEEADLVLPFSTQKQNSVWALNPEMLKITTELVALKLERKAIRNKMEDEEEIQTFGSWYIPKEWNDALKGLPSLDQVFYKSQATATYTMDRFPRHSMYKNFYLNGQINRVVGHEHTSLLEREYREALEQRFMAKGGDRKYWYENLLSATPTLEMGIDIGDLSTVMLCSVPPSQTNYLQRAGRGGRKDGNSFVFTVANGHPHDLYFYSDPFRMIAGDIQAPAIYLNATMVLKRQLLAFCFDQWVVSSEDQRMIPATMQPILDAIENHDSKRFPYTILEYIGKNRDVLWEGFENLLGSNVSKDTKNKLKVYMLETSQDDDVLHVHVLERLKTVMDMRKTFVSNQKDLESELRALLKKPQDEARDNHEDELNKEIEGTKRLKTQLNRKETLNFFTDEGLLPNYAFPEEGTTLHSVIYRKISQSKKQENGKSSNFESKALEYKRPSHSALSELAPESIFYASNRKVQIERIEMAKGKNLEEWRLCPNCSYSQKILGADQDVVCPRCRDEMWANVSQKIQMVRLKQVYANTRDEDAFIGDDSDTREPTFFNRQMLIDFDRSDITLAYALKTDTKAFGFEFIKKAKFKEINFGKQGGTDQIFNVAGQEMPRPGFKLCKECGMVQSKRNKKNHMYKCQYRNSDTSDNKTPGIIDCLYLYREYESEAIRILMPRLSPVNREEQVQSFVAAIQLGLKAQFGGKVDHLHLTIHDEPSRASGLRDYYLYIYDTVPGGTGYLHELLADPKNLMGMLKQAQEVMAKCDCQNHPELDGCYSCLYAYRNSYGMEQKSRTTALLMLSYILDENIELEKIENLGNIKTNDLFDSKLEERFIEAVESLNNNPVLGTRIRKTKDIINGNIGFTLEIGKQVYTVEVHARLNEKDGVAYPCEPDFLIRSVRESDDIPPIAIFLDGYRYHKDIVHEDLMKRQGIFLTGRYLTWSLTWYDVNQVFAGSEIKIPNVFRENIDGSPREYLQKICEMKGINDYGKIVSLNPLLMLIKYLSKPNIEEWQNYAVLQALHWVDSTMMGDSIVLEKIKNEWASWPSQFIDECQSLDFRFGTIHAFEDKSVSLKMYIAGDDDAVKSLNVNKIMLTTVFQMVDSETEIAQRTWQRLLQILNLGQFLPNFFAGTEKGITQGSFSKLSWGKADKKIVTSEWDMILNQADEDIGKFLISLSEQGVALPIVGYELCNLKGACIAEAELAWPDKKIVFLMDYQVEDSKSVFEKLEWAVETDTSCIDVLAKKLGV